MEHLFSVAMTKNLSFAAIVVIAANTMNGPGLTTLPSMASAAGELLFSILVVVAALVASFVLKRLCSVMWTSGQVQLVEPEERELDDLLQNDQTHGKMKAHLHDRPKLEETDIVALSEKLFSFKKSAAWAMVGCALSLALAQMMLCAAIADSMLVAAVGQSCGLAPHVVCTSHLSMKPFQDQDSPVSLLSAGLVVASTITVALAAVDLDSMVVAQYFLFGCLVASCARFSFTLQDMGSVADDFFPNAAPLWVGARPFDAVGPILFNFAFVVTAPPLICGAETAMGATWALVVACILMAVLYSLVGYVGANAAHQRLDNNLLSLVLQGSDPDTLNLWDILAVVLFGLSQLAAIPVYCELARETLTSHLQFSNKHLTFLASHVGPWIIVALTYNSELFEAFVEWSSLLLLGFANFSVPLVLDHVFTLRLQHMEGVKWHGRRVGSACPGIVAWGLAMITASIAAVIAQRITESLLVAEIIFLIAILIILHQSQETKQNSPDKENNFCEIDPSSFSNDC